MRELSRWPCCYIKRLSKMENWEIHCDPQIYRKDFIRRCSQTFTTLVRPIKGFICNCNTDPSSIFKTSSTMGQKKSDFQLTLGPRLSIWNIFQITAWHDWIHQLKSLQKIQFLELHLLQMKHLHHKLLQNKKIKPQSRMLSLLYNLQLQMTSTTMRMKCKCLQWATK